VKSQRRAELLHVVEGHERKGDVAREHHLYEDAAQYYQNALNIRAVDSSDRYRISEKRAYALFLGGNPRAANQWLERALPSHLQHLGTTPEAVELLLQRAQFLRVDAKFEAGLPLLQRAIEIAGRLDNPRFYKLANLAMALCLNTLGRYESAEEHLAAAGQLTEKDDTALCVTYYRAHALVAASLGRAQMAYRYFESAVRAAEDDPDVFRIVGIWENYGLSAITLGNIELAKTCTERGLLIARRHQIAWSIPALCLRYANILMKMGQYDVAHRYVLDALSSVAHAPVLEEDIAEFGIPLALRLNDRVLLTRCARSPVLRIAFQSKAPGGIVGVAAAFARFYIAQGEVRKARMLLNRALAGVDVDLYGGLSLEVARHGANADIPQARRLLEMRTEMPASNVARACLALFDALVAKRRKELTKMHEHAQEAVALFTVLHWYGYVDEARSLLPSVSDTQPVQMYDSKPFANTPVLTSRERQIADLVLKGSTNREIAAALSISERTVEVHMTSIMSRIGVRSRHQLVDHIAHEQAGRTGFHDA